MSRRAWMYIYFVMLLGLIFTALGLRGFAPGPSELITFATLAVLATLAQLFKAEGTSHVAFFATPVFYFAGVMLLNPLLFICLVMIPLAAEWANARLKRGEHLRAWYIQPFNMGMHIIAGSIAHLVLVRLNNSTILPFVPSPVFGVAAAVTTYLLVSQSLLAVVLILARDMTLRETGIYSIENLLPEFIMLCVGITVAVLWRVSPWVVTPALLPLFLMYRALTIPQLKQEAQTDGKTGLLNARHFNKMFLEEIERAKRFDRPVALIMADLDLLRNINNTYGHLAGDAVLTGIGKVIRKTIREFDIAGRFGGEEFAILLPEAGPDEAWVLAERVRQAIAAATFEVQTSTSPLQATISLGVACFPQDATAANDLIHEADVAVYQAKLQGRNRVICATDVPHSVKLSDAPIANRLAAPYNGEFVARPDGVGGPFPDPTISDQGVPGIPIAPSAPLHAPPLADAEPANLVHNPVQWAAAARRRDDAVTGSSAADTAETSDAGSPAPERGAAVHAGDTGAPATLWFFLSAVILTGTVAMLLGLELTPSPNWLAIGVMASLSALAELLHVKVYGNNSISVTVAPLFAAVMVGGAPGLACVSATIVVVHHLRQRRGLRELHKSVFNWANHVVAGLAPLFAFQLIGRPSTLLLLLVLIGLAATASLMYYAIETTLLSIVISLSKGTSFKTTWREQFRWLSVHYCVLGILGLFLGMAYSNLGVLGVLVFALPVAMMHYAQKQYVERTQDSMRELKRMNVELARANGEVVSASSAIHQLNKDLKQLNDELFLTLGKILDARDPYVGSHAAQVAHYATAIARELGLPEHELELVRQAGFLHDIGKIAISEQVLHKPSKLTAEEYEYIKTHATVGAELLETSKGLRHLAPFVRHHHERWDGKGYPGGLRDEEIPLPARILAVCDSVEAMASDRPYHRSLSVPEIIAEVERCAGTQFDPVVARMFVKIVEREGPSFVVNSATGIVLKQGSAGSLWKSQSLILEQLQNVSEHATPLPQYGPRTVSIT